MKTRPYQYTSLLCFCLALALLTISSAFGNPIEHRQFTVPVLMSAKSMAAIREFYVRKFVTLDVHNYAVGSRKFCVVHGVNSSGVVISDVLVYEYARGQYIMSAALWGRSGLPSIRTSKKGSSLKISYSNSNRIDNISFNDRD